MTSRPHGPRHPAGRRPGRAPRAGRLGGVDGVETRGESVIVHAKDSDAVARFLLTHTDARDLEITAHGLEEAFLSLTDEGDDVMTHPHERTRPSTRPPAGSRRFGGVNLTVLGIELRRMLRNRRTIIFTLVFPAALLLSFGGQDGWDDKAGVGNVAAYILVSMGLYGAALTAAAGGSMVALERSLGWSRQLRLTPLHPVAYILMKTLVALVMGALGDRRRERRRRRCRARPRCRRTSGSRAPSSRCSAR